MNIIFGSWKYIIKNIWYILPFALVPAAFLALSLDYASIRAYVNGFFSGAPKLGFVEYFRVWSLIRVDSLFGAICSVCSIAAIIFFGSIMFVLVEKHMRLGKRTLNSVFSQIRGAIYFVSLFTLFFTILYEAWVVILAAILFMIASVGNVIAVYVLDVIAYAALFFVLFYGLAMVYLWLPCRLMTGFKPFDSFLYSYRLGSGVRGRLVLAFMIFFAIAIAVLGLAALLPEYLFFIVTLALYAFLFLDFCVRMETVYFYTDKLDREDLRHGWGY